MFDATRAAAGLFEIRFLDSHGTSVSVNGWQCLRWYLKSKGHWFIGKCKNVLCMLDKSHQGIKLPDSVLVENCCFGFVDHSPGNFNLV